MKFEEDNVLDTSLSFTRNSSRIYHAVIVSDSVFLFCSSYCNAVTAEIELTI